MSDQPAPTPTTSTPGSKLDKEMEVLSHRLLGRYISLLHKEISIDKIKERLVTACSELTNFSDETADTNVRLLAMVDSNPTLNAALIQIKRLMEQAIGTFMHEANVILSTPP